MSGVFRLVLPGNRVRSARPQAVIVSELYANPKIALGKTPPHIGILKVDIVGGPIYANGDITTWYSFEHGYDYVPSVVGLFEETSSGTSNGGILPYSGVGALGEVFLDADTKNVNLKFESFDVFGGIALPERHFFIRYYIIADPGLDT